MQLFGLKQRVRSLLEPTVESLGFELVAVEWLSGTLRLSIDTPTGVTANDCAKVARNIGPLLDAEDPIPSHYRLEVSSPGIERPIERIQDFERFTGRTIKIRLEPGHPQRRFTGIIAGLDGTNLVLRTPEQDHRLPIDAIERAQLDPSQEPSYDHQ